MVSRRDKIQKEAKTVRVSVRSTSLGGMTQNFFKPSESVRFRKADFPPKALPPLVSAPSSIGECRRTADMTGVKGTRA
jgi:hypothetical protein